MAEFVDFVSARIPAREFLGQYAPGQALNFQRDNVQLWCVFHEEKKAPSLSVSLDGKFNCFSCGKKGSSFVSFYALLQKTTLQRAATELYEQFIEKVVADQLVETYHSQLMLNERMLKELKEKRGYTTETIREWRLGWDGQRLTIPIVDRWGFCVNLRRYSSKATNKMLSLAGHGAARLFPEPETMGGKKVLVVEGEWDMMLARQIGLPALTGTCGAETWKEDWGERFEGRAVDIIYDCDAAGIDGAARVAENIFAYAESVRVGNLGLEDGEDFSDYILKHKKKLSEVQWKVWQGSTQKKTLPVVSLQEACEGHNFGKRFTLRATLMGKDLAPYLLPKQVTQKCPMVPNREKHCVACTLQPVPREHVAHIVLEPDDVPELCGSTKFVVRGWIKRKIGIPTACPCEVTPLVMQEVERLQMIPPIEQGATRTDPYLTRMGYYIGKELQTNKSYSFKAATTVEPASQRAVHVLEEAKPLEADLDTFKMDNELMKSLSVFQADEGKVEEKLNEICEHLSNNVTNIFSRDDLHIAFDLVAHSIIAFNLGGERLHRGWLDALVIGDTRTGKGQVASKLCDYYRAGEVVSAENSTYAGLVGGVQPSAGGTWMITWGKLPLNDRRMVVVDETSAMPIEDIGRLSRLRSEGIAEITKIQFQRVHSRTRLLWISNPRSGRPLETYDYGVSAVKELFGRTEDLSRLDFVLGIAWSEVDSSIINRPSPKPVKTPYTSELCSKLILWAWSRTSSQVRFSKEAYAFILDTSKHMGEKFSGALPLLQMEDCRLKLARMSAALAVRLFSTEDGETVEVTREHADYCYNFLQNIYAKPCMSYAAYSTNQKEYKAIKNETELNLFMEGLGEFQKTFVIGALAQPRLARTDMANYCGVAWKESLYYVSRLVQYGAIYRENSYYRKNAWFTEYLKEVKRRKQWET